MEDRNDVALRIANIQEIFQDARQISEQEDHLDALTDRLDKNDPEFRSVAYEGASMGLALKDLSTGFTRHHWRLFLDGPGARHKTQVHIGMGWAIAEERIPASSMMSGLDPLLSHRVYDGYGFYDGMFRFRHSVGLQKRSVEIQEKYFQAYDQGVGRSLWYRQQGNPSRISEIIDRFPQDRQENLWLGIGIACTYVGGFVQSTLDDLTAMAGGHSVQLAMGAALSVRSRIQAGSLTDFSEMACRNWCRRSSAEVMQLIDTLEPAKRYDPEKTFADWLSGIKSALILY